MISDAGRQSHILHGSQGSVKPTLPINPLFLSAGPEVPEASPSSKCTEPPRVAGGMVNGTEASGATASKGVGGGGSPTRVAKGGGSGGGGGSAKGSDGGRGGELREALLGTGMNWNGSSDGAQPLFASQGAALHQGGEGVVGSSTIPGGWGLQGSHLLFYIHPPEVQRQTELSPHSTFPCPYSEGGIPMPILAATRLAGFGSFPFLADRTNTAGGASSGGGADVALPVGWQSLPDIDLQMMALYNAPFMATHALLNPRVNGSTKLTCGCDSPHAAIIVFESMEKAEMDGVVASPLFQGDFNDGSLDLIHMRGLSGFAGRLRFADVLIKSEEGGHVDLPFVHSAKVFFYYGRALCGSNVIFHYELRLD